jgi:hypothetical protein
MPHVDDQADDPRAGVRDYPRDGPTGPTVEASTIDTDPTGRRRQLGLAVMSVVVAAAVVVLIVRPWDQTGGHQASRSLGRRQASTTASSQSSGTRFTTTSTTAPALVNGSPTSASPGRTCANGFFSPAVSQALEQRVGDLVSCDLVGDTWIVSYLTAGRTNGIVAFLRCAPADATCHRSDALHDFAAFTAAYLGPVPSNSSYVQFDQGGYPQTPPSIKVYAFVPGSGNPYPPLPLWTITASVSLIQNRITLSVACLKGRTGVEPVPYRDAFELLPGPDRQESLITGAQVLSQPMPREPVTTKPNC